MDQTLVVENRPKRPKVADASGR